jgi:hypothetical protein
MSRQPPAKPVLRDPYNLVEGDVYVVGEVPRSYLERGGSSHGRQNRPDEYIGPFGWRSR